MSDEIEVRGLDEALARIGHNAKGERTTWNHRVLRKPPLGGGGPILALAAGGGPVLVFAEVHYTDGKPAFYSEPFLYSDCETEAESLADLRKTLERMTKALELPILDVSEFASGPDDGTPEGEL